MDTVGDAYHSRDYYGDNEDLRGENFGAGASEKYDANTINMVIGVPKTVDIVDSATIKFTAEEEGTYVLYNGKGQSVDGSRTLADNETGYFSVYSYTGSLIIKRTGSTNSSATDFKNRKNIKAGEAFSVKSGHCSA